MVINGNTDLIRFLTKSFHIVWDFADFQKLCGIVRLWLNCAAPHLRTLSEGLHCANPALQLKLSHKKTAKGTIWPLQNLWKKLELHTWRDLVQYRNCKLKQNVESILYCMFKVHMYLESRFSHALLNMWHTSHAQPSVVNTPGNL